MVVFFLDGLVWEGELDGFLGEGGEGFLRGEVINGCLVTDVGIL